MSTHDADSARISAQEHCIRSSPDKPRPSRPFPVPAMLRLLGVGPTVVADAAADAGDTNCAECGCPSESLGQPQQRKADLEFGRGLQTPRLRPSDPTPVSVSRSLGDGQTRLARTT